jgi:hypothetical protein
MIKTCGLTAILLSDPGTETWENRGFGKIVDIK